MSDFGPWPGTIETPTEPIDNPATTSIDAIVPYWEDAPHLWDQVTIAGITLPGLARTSGQVGRKLDKKKTKGQDGATVTDDGADLPEVEITIQMWNRDHWSAYQRLIPLLDLNAPRGQKGPVDVEHPALALHEIRSLAVETMTLPTPGRVKQAYEVRFKGVGWRPPPPQPTGSKSTTANEAANDPLAKREKEAGSATGTKFDSANSEP